MTKQIRYIIITICILAVLGVVLILIKFLPSGKTAKTASSSGTSSSSGISLIKVDKSNVATVHIANSNGAYTIRKGSTATTSSGTSITWTVDEYSSSPLSQSAISNIVDETTTLTASLLVTQSSSDIGQYGLATPKATVELKTTDGKTYAFFVGNATPTKDGYYAMMKGENSVYIISTTDGDDFTAASSKLIDLSLVTLDQAKLTTLTDITFGGSARTAPIKLAIDTTSVSSYSATTDSSGNVMAPAFRITSPGSYSANTTCMNTIVNALVALSASDIVSMDTTDKTLTQYGLKNPAYTFTFSYDKKSYTLSFGNTFTKDSSEYIYMTISGKNIIYDIPTSTVAFYKYQLADVGPSLLYTAANIDTVKTITVTVGANTWKYSLSGTGDALKVTADSKTLKTDQFRNFYQQLIAMSPQGTATAGSNSTVLCRITFEFREGNKSDVIELKTLPDANDASKTDEYRALCSVNGNANFYVKKSMVDSYAKYAQDIIDGKTIPTP